MKKLHVTTSWDDGDALDERLAQLLKYNLKGTFYVTQEYRKQRLSDEQIREISLRHEIGAHTLTHPDLRKLTIEQKKHEIGGSRDWLEGVLGKKVPMFCYPAGHLDTETERVVRECGFTGARTTQLGKIIPPANPFLMPTTVQAYPMPFRKLGGHSFYWGRLFQPLEERGPALRVLGVPLIAFRSWETLACTTFDIALRRGGVFHVWGHSWEVEQYDMWEPLERVLRYIGNRSDCLYSTNGEVAQLS